MAIQKLTKEQAVVVSGFTGIVACPFADIHEEIERRVGRPVYTHELGDTEFGGRVRELFRDDFLEMCYGRTPENA